MEHRNGDSYTDQRGSHRLSLNIPQITNLALNNMVVCECVESRKNKINCLFHVCPDELSLSARRLKVNIPLQPQNISK